MSDQLKTIVLGDAAVQVAAADVAAIEQFKTDSAKALADAESTHKQAIEAKDEEIGTLKADLKKAQDAAVIDVDALVAARSELVASVKSIDDSIDPKGKTDAELRKAAVSAKYGDEMVADASDAEINGMFKALAKDSAEKNPVREAIKTGDNVASFDDSRNAYLDRLTRRSKQEA